MKRLNLLLIFIFMMGIWVKMPIQLKAQAKFKATKVEMKVKGTSNLHDWDMDKKSVQTEACSNRNGCHYIESGEVTAKCEGYCQW